MSDSEKTESQSYIVEIEKFVEVDCSTGAADVLKRRRNVDSAETALAKTIAAEERNTVEPEEKLLRLEVNVDETSDD